MMIPMHHRPPPAPAETILNEATGYFSAIVADGTTNLVTNPSAETGTTGHSGQGGAVISRVTTKQRHGIYAFQCIPGVSTTSGHIYNSVPVIIPAPAHTASLDFYGVAGRPYRLELADGGSVVASHRFIATGRWQREAVTGAITVGTSVQIRIRKDGFASTAPFWSDGWQLEAKGYATTYCDGDMRGQQPFDFYWTGTPHASQSVRAGTTRAGGRIVNFQHFGFKLLAYMGLGSLLLSTITTPLTTGGAVVQDQRMAESSLSLLGVMSARDLADLQRQRGPLFAALRGAQSQIEPLVLHYQPCDDEGNPTGDMLSIPCYWQPSPGETTSTHYSRVTLDFSIYLPLIAKGHGGAIIPARQTITPFDHIAMRSPVGAWSTSFSGTTGANNTINALAVGADGTLYAAGAFTSIGGQSITRLAYWTGSAWSGLSGSGPNGLVRAMVVAPNGDVYIGGDFTAIGALAVNRIAKWSAVTLSWSALGTGVNAPVYALGLGIDGTLYAGGAFTTAGGGAASRVARWNGSAWSALYAGVNNDVYAMKIVQEGMYIGGLFTSVNGTPTGYIALWDGLAWHTLGDGLGETVYAIEARNGTVYAAGLFETTGAGAPAEHVAQWTGNQWSAMGGGIASAGGAGDGVFTLTALADGTIIAAGDGLVQSGTTPLLENLALWNGSIWSPLDIDFTGVGSGVKIFVSTQLQDGTLVIAPNTSGLTAGVPVPTTATVGGTLPTWPVVKFAAPSNAPATVYQLINETTGAAIYLNLVLLAGEVATLDLTPGQISLSTNFRPNRMDTILGGSDLANWRLLPGANVINAFGSTSSMTVTLEWDERVQSLDDATWSPPR